MKTSTRRILAVTLSTALVSAPALTFGSSAQASTPAPTSTTTARLDLIGGLLGGLTGSGSGATAGPITAVLDSLTGLLAPVTGGTGGTGTVTDPISGLADLLSDTLTSNDPVGNLLGSLTQLLDPTQASELLDVLAGNTDLLGSLTDVLLGALPLTELFGGPIPAPITDILAQNGKATPADTAGLIAALTSIFQGKTPEQVKNDDAAKTLPPAALAALLLALSKKPTTPPTTIPKPTGPSASCVAATKKVKTVQKQLKTAKKKHLKAKSKKLAKKLKKVRTATQRAC